MVVTYTSSENLRFSLLSVQNGTATDLYMRLQAPVKNGWGAAGIGDQMAGAMIFLTYPSSDGKSSTLSVRHASGEFEPEPTKNNCKTQEAETSDTTINTAFVCYGLGDDPRLKNSRNADWIWSVGPGITVDSNSVDAEIQMHSHRGFFSLDMVQAKQPVPGSSGNMPLAPLITPGSDIGSQVTSSMVSPSETLVKTHAVLLGVAFLVFFPLGIFLLRLRGTRLHWISQMFGFLCSIAGFVIAIVMSAQSEEYKSFMANHQILGLVTVCLLFPQVALGFFNHQIFKKKGKSSWMALPHLALGRIVIILGLVNAILGFLLKDNSEGAIIFGVFALVVVLVIAAFIIWNLFRKPAPVKDGLQRSEIPTEK